MKPFGFTIQSENKLNVLFSKEKSSFSYSIRKACVNEIKDFDAHM